MLLHVNSSFRHVYEGVFPFNLKDEEKTPLQGYFVTKGRILTLMEPIYCFEGFCFAGIKMSTHLNFGKFRQDET